MAHELKHDFPQGPGASLFFQHMHPGYYWAGGAAFAWHTALSEDFREQLEVRHKRLSIAVRHHAFRMPQLRVLGLRILLWQRHDTPHDLMTGQTS